MTQVAPASTECPSWTGFYVGGFGGYKYGSIDANLQLLPPWDEFPDDVRLLEGHGNDNLNTSGAELGGLLGFNYQWHNWVFGAEAAGGYLWLRESNVTDHFIANTSDEYHLSTSFKTHYLATVGPRLGYALCRWLPYVTGGAAFGDFDFKQELTQHNTSFPFREGGKTTDTNVGWFVGGGLQYAISNHWSARLQYQYVDLGDVQFHHSARGFNVNGSLVEFPGRSQVELREHNASFALIYGF